jgi:UPF0716 protein FxsA
MPVLILAAFIGVPLLEIAVFIQVGGWLGLWPTLALVVLSAVIGTWELRAQGLATLARARAVIDAGEVPTREIFDGACLLIAGVLLLTPGFVTDALGLLLFMPAVRAFLRRWLARRVTAATTTTTTSRVFVDGVEVRQTKGGGPVIDGDYRDVSDDTPRKPPPLSDRRPK